MATHPKIPPRPATLDQACAEAERELWSAGRDFGRLPMLRVTHPRIRG